MELPKTIYFQRHDDIDKCSMVEDPPSTIYPPNGILAYRSMNCPTVKHLRNKIDRCSEEKKQTLEPAEAVICGGAE